MRFFKLLKLELLNHVRHYNDMTTPLWFLILIITIFSISLQHQPHLLQESAPAMIWVSLLLSLLLAFPNLFSHDYESGLLEQVFLSPISLSEWVLIKLLAFFIASCMPLILSTPLLGLFLHLSYDQIVTLLISLSLATPSLLLLGALNAALTVRLNNNALILTLLTLPLSIPIVLFGISTSVAQQMGLSTLPPFCFLTALLLISISLLPFAIAFALKIGTNT